MGFEPNDERTVDNLPENQFEGGGADIDSDGLAAAGGVAAPKRARLTLRSRSAGGAQTGNAAPSEKGMPPRTEEHTPPPVRKPLMRPSSEFGYLFSDSEPVDTHMDDSYSRRLDGLAYDGSTQSDGDYSELLEGEQPSMVRRPENRMSAEGYDDSSRTAQPAERPSRFSRRTREAAPVEEAPAQEPVIEEQPAAVYVPEAEAQPAAEEQPADYGRDDRFAEEPRRRRYEEDIYDRRERRERRYADRQTPYGAPRGAYPPYGQYPGAYPPGYGYPPYGYPQYPVYPPYGQYPAAYPPGYGYPPYGYAYPVQPGMYPPGVIPVQIVSSEPPVQPVEVPALPAEAPAPVQAAPAEPVTQPAAEEKTEDEIPPHPLPPMSFSFPEEDSRSVDDEFSFAEEQPAQESPAPQPQPEPARSEGSSRFNRRSRSEAAPVSTSAPDNDSFFDDDDFGGDSESSGTSSAAESRSARFNRRSRSSADSFAAPADSAPAGGTDDWFGDDDGFGDSGSSADSTPPSGGRSARFNRRSR